MIKCLISVETILKGNQMKVTPLNWKIKYFLFEKNLHCE